MAITGTSNTTSTLVKTLETQVNESETSSYEVGEQRERNHRYYSLEAIGNEQRGRSHYISPDVLDAVEGKKALFSETFLSARDVCKFVECSVPGEAPAKTAYANKQYKRNNYERLFRDGWHDAFVAKRMVVLAEWYNDTKEETLQLPGVPMQQVQQALQQMEVVDVDDSGVQMQELPTPQGPMQIMSGELKVTTPDGYVKLTLIQPERYFRDPDATYVDTAQWNTIEEDMARGQLISLGYDEEQVMNLAVDYRFRSEEEDAARKKHDSSWTRRKQHNRIDEQETVAFYRTWTWLKADDDLFADENLSFEPSPDYQLYEIHWSTGEVLNWAAEEAPEGEEAPTSFAAIRPVEECGIYEWTEMKVSHAEMGLCTADVMAHTQKTTSGLKRLIIDNQNMANSSRNIAITGALKNPRDLLDNKIGATLWAKRPDAVTPLPAPVLSPLTMTTLQMMKSDGEERSGMSGLAKGMNQEALSKQNADSMVERLTTAGQRRVTSAARDFANTFLVPLTQYIVRLGMENDPSQDQMEIAGQQLPIVPSQWSDDEMHMEVAVALTPDESQRMGQQLLMMNTMMSQDPTLQMSYGPEQKHALLDMVFDLIGVTDTSNILLSPQSPQYQQKAQQAQQMQMQQMQETKQKEDAMFGLQLETGKTQMTLAQSADQREWQKFSWDQTDDMADNLLNQEKHEWDIDRESQELEIERTQKRPVSAT